MARLYDTGIFSVNATNGAVGSGYKLNFYTTGTSTRKNTYPTRADAVAGTNANANPISAAADGRWAPIWLTSGDYKVVLTDLDDVVLETRDPGDSEIDDSANIDFLQAGADADSRSVQSKLRDVVSVKDFGAVGDGTTDDTAAIQDAIDYVESVAPAALYLPGGTYKTTSTLTIDTSKVAMIGAGPYQTAIIGNFATGDIIQVGVSGAETENIYLADFRVDSSVNKTAGAGIELEKVVRSRIERVIFAGQDGEGDDSAGDHHLWDGLVLNKVDWVRVIGFEARAENDCIRVWGGGSGSGNPRGSDVTIFDGKITGGGYGIHAAGDVGGLHIDQCSLNNCDLGGVLIDQSQQASGNRQIFLGSGVDIDGESIAGVRQQPGIIVNDAGMEDLFLDGVWFSVHTYGIDIQSCSSTATKIHITGGRIAQCDDDGIRIASEPAVLMINGVEFADITGIGINATVDCTNNGDGRGVFVYPTNLFYNCTGGDVTWNNIGVLSGTSINVSIADDEAFSFKPRDFTTLGSNGLIYVGRANSTGHSLFYYRADSGGANTTTINTSGITLTTGALAGTTGVDGELTVSAHTDEKIYIENRLGSAVTISVQQIAAHPGTMVQV